MVFLLTLWMVTEFKPTDIFMPLVPGLVAIGDQGDLYVCDYAENKILLFDATGNQKATFGRKGQGPGEFQRLFQIQVIGGAFYAIGMTGCHEFTTDGQFVKRHASAQTGVMLAPSVNGWLETRHEVDLATQGTKTIFSWLDKNRVLVNELGSYDVPIRLSGSPGNMAFNFNPAESRPSVMTDRMGRFLVFSMGKEAIRVYAVLPDFRQVASIPIPDRAPIPFNESWGDELWEKMKSVYGVGGKITLTKAFPSYFPIIQGVQFTPNNDIAVILWAADPEQPEFLFYGLDGNPSATSWTQEAMKRIVALRDGAAYVLGYDEENEDYIVLRMPKDEAEAWIAANPYTEEVD